MRFILPIYNEENIALLLQGITCRNYLVEDKPDLLFCESKVDTSPFTYLILE